MDFFAQMYDLLFHVILTVDSDCFTTRYSPTASCSGICFGPCDLGIVPLYNV